MPPNQVPRPIRGLLRHIDAWIRARIADRREGVVPFYRGRYAATGDRAALVARTYYEADQIADLFELHVEVDPSAEPGIRADDSPGIRAVDIGCGYGRLTPYLADLPAVTSVHGVEPDDKARERAAELYPHVTFADGVAQDIPYPTDHFGLAVAWTVLQHVPDRAVEQVAAELTTVVKPGGYLMTCDKTAGIGTAVLHPRPVAHYEALLSGFELVASRERALEPGSRRDGENTVMLFRRTDR